MQRSFFQNWKLKLNKTAWKLQNLKRKATQKYVTQTVAFVTIPLLVAFVSYLLFAFN